MLRRLQARYMVTASGERSLVTLARDNLEWRKMKKKHCVRSLKSSHFNRPKSCPLSKAIPIAQLCRNQDAA